MAWKQVTSQNCYSVYACKDGKETGLQFLSFLSEGEVN